MSIQSHVDVSENLQSEAAGSKVTHARDRQTLVVVIFSKFCTL